MEVQLKIIGEEKEPDIIVEDEHISLCCSKEGICDILHDNILLTNKIDRLLKTINYLSGERDDYKNKYDKLYNLISSKVSITYNSSNIIVDDSSSNISSNVDNSSNI